MSVQDINPARPRYLSWTLFRDYHYAVFNKAGVLIYILVTNKGELRSYWSEQVDPRTQSVVYENSSDKARIMSGYYIRESTDLSDLLKKHFPVGEYFLSVVDASGKRLFSYSIWI